MNSPDDDPGCTLVPGGLSTCYCTGRAGCQSPPSGDADGDDWETPCPGKPITPGVTEDGQHCECWYDGAACCRCNDPADPNAEEALLRNGCEHVETPEESAAIVDANLRAMGCAGLEGTTSA